FRVVAWAGGGAVVALLLFPALLLAQPGHNAGQQRSPQRTEAELLRQLQRDAVEIDVHARFGYVNQLVDSVRPKESTKGKAGSTRRRLSPVHTLAELKQREDLNGLPMRDEPECNKAVLSARLMEQVANSVRESMTYFAGGSSESLA